MNITTDRATPGFPVNVKAGQVVSIALPAGWVLKVSPGYVDWFDISPPFTAPPVPPPSIASFRFSLFVIDKGILLPLYNAVKGFETPIFDQFQDAEQEA